MEEKIRLDSLIEEIKTKGIEQAELEKKKIIEQAEKLAKEKIVQAEKAVKEKLEQAQKEIKQYEDNSRKTLQQAARDIVLLVKENLKKTFSQTLLVKVQESFTEDFLQSLIVKVVNQWMKEEGKIYLSAQDSDKLLSLLQKELQNKLAKGLEIKVDDTLEKGFRIQLKDKDLYYDFSDEAICQALSLFLDDSLQKLLFTHKEEEKNG